MHAPMASIRIARLFVAVVLLCTTSSAVQAWGEKGHRIVGHMAHDLLSAEIRRNGPEHRFVAE